MCRLLAGMFFLFAATALAADPPAKAKDALQIGANLPGTFLPYNATGTFKGRFHCLVSDYGLEPVVMLFVRDLEPSNSLSELLKQLDERIDLNPAARLHAFAVFVTDDQTDVLTDNDKREVMARKLEDLANQLMLKNVVFCLDSPKDVQKYALGERWGMAVLYAKYRIVAVHELAKADTKAEVDKILADVATKLKAAKTK
jgi:hypothetical protein